MFSDKHVSFLLLRLGLILSKKLRGRNWRQNKIKLSGGVWLEILAHPSMWRGQMQWCSWFPETVFSMTFVTGTSSKPGVRLTIRFNYPGVWFQSPGCSEGESSGRACTSRLLLHTCHRFVLFLCSLEHQVCFLLHPCAYFLWKKKKKDRYQEKQEESCPCPVSGASSLSFLAIPPSRCHSCPHASMVSVCLQQKTKHLTLPSCKCHHELHTALQPSVMLSCASPLYLNLWSLLCFFIICYRNTYHSLFLRMIFWFNVHWIFIWRISHFSAIRTMFFCVSFPTDKSRT